MPNLFAVEVDCYLGLTSTTTQTIVSAQTKLTWNLAPAPVGDTPKPIVGMVVRFAFASAPSTNYMEGIVLDVYPNGSLTSVQILVHTWSGAGSSSSWVLSTGRLYFSTHPRTNRTGDPLANLRFEPRVLQAGEIARFMFDRGTTGGGSRIEAGDIVLANPDGALDQILNYGMDGLPVTIRTATIDEGGSRPVYPGGFTTVLVGTGARATADWASITLSLRTRQMDLDIPLQPLTYAGNNALPAGLEGTADDLKGRTKPIVYGSATNMSPPLVNSSRLIYQASSAGIAGITAVYDRGVALVQNATYTSQADMEANAPAAGQFRVWITAAGAYFRLGSSPAGTVTADVNEGNAAFNRSVSGIVQRIMAARAPLIAVKASDLTDLQTAQPAEVEYFADSDVTVAAALDQLCASIGAWWGFDKFGVFRIKRLDAPTYTASPVAWFARGHDDALSTSEFDILAFDLYAPADQAGGLPVPTVKLTWGPVWTVQTDLAGSVTAARKGFLALERRETVPATDATTRAKHPLGESLKVDTLLKTEAAATAEAARILAMRKIRRDRVVLRTKMVPTLPDLEMGDEVRVTLPRFGYDDGRAFRIIGIRLDARAEILTLELWG